MLFPKDIVSEYVQAKHLKLKNGTTYKLDANNNFTHDGTSYIIYNNCTTTRTHTSLTEFTTQLYSIPMIMESSVALDVVNYIINLNCFLMNFVDKSGRSLKSKTWTEACDALMSELKLTVNQSSIEQANMIIESLDALYKSISLDRVEKALHSSKIIPINATLDIKSPLGTVLSGLMSYVGDYITFGEGTINHRLLNSSMDLIFTVISLFADFKSTLIHTDLFTDKPALIGNRMAGFVYDFLTDRVTKELFIKRRNKIACDLINQYEAQFPFLRNNNVDAINSQLVLSNLMATLENESLELYPYITLLYVDDNTRLAKLYAYFSANQKALANTNFKWPSRVEYFNIIKSFVPSLNTPLIYDSTLLLDSLPKIINLENLQMN